MTPTPIFYARVSRESKVVFDDPLAWAHHVGMWRGQPVEVTLRKRRTQRSLQSNRYYFGVVIAAIAEHCGYTKDEAHEAVAWKFLQCGEPDAKLPKRLSTAELSSDAFREYVETVKRFAATELGIYVPDPATVDA